MRVKWFALSLRVAAAFFVSLAATHQTGAKGMGLWTPPVVAALTTAEAGLATLTRTRAKKARPSQKGVPDA